MKITPSDTAISSSDAFMIGPTAAIALPPHIAVPEEMRYDVFLLRCNQCPSKTPNAITPTTEAIVNNIPLLPDFSESTIFIPNPNPTTETCSRYLDAFLLNLANGMGKIKAYINPINKDIAGVIANPILSCSNGKMINSNIRKYTILFICRIYLVVQISHAANACSNSISNPFFVSAPYCAAFFINKVTSGLYRRS